MTGLLLAVARRQAARTIGTAGAVLVAVAFVVSTILMSDALARTLEISVAAPYVGTDAYVTAAAGSDAVVGQDLATTVARVPGVRAVALDGSGVARRGGGSTRYLTLTPSTGDPALQWQTLADGRWPTGPGEALSGDTGDLGGDVVLRPAGGSGEPVTVRVVGLLDHDAAGYLPDTVVVDPGTILRVDPGSTWTGLRVIADESADEGGDQAALEARIEAALQASPGLAVSTGQEQVRAAVASVTGNRVFLTTILLVFAGISLLVAALVIANTQAVVMAQRTRQLALLRCVGATRRQLVTSSLAEAAITGVAAAVLGAAAGVGLAAAALAAVGASPLPIQVAGLVVHPSALLIGILTGTLVTVLAALAPILRASRVTPVAALRPIEAVAGSRRFSRVRIIIGAVLAVPAAGLLLVVCLAFPSGGGAGFVAAFGLGVVSFVGVAVLAQPVTAAVVSMLDRSLRGVLPPAAGVTLANAQRNPRRTGATASALLVGVTLIGTVTVATASVRAGTEEILAGAFPTDVLVSGDQLPASLADGLRSVDGVAAGAALRSAEVTIAAGGAPVTVYAAGDASPGSVLREGDLTAPPSGILRLSPSDARANGVTDGQTIAVTGPGGQVELKVSAVAGTVPPVPLVAAPDLDAVSPGAPVTAVLQRLSDDLDRAGREAAVVGVADRAGAAAPEAFVASPVRDRDQLAGILDGLLAVTAGLLGVAVLIAVIGVSTTLALSVHERRQENGLLRSLGMTRGQIRGLVVGEAVLLAALAAVAGVVLGIGYGSAGSASLLGSDSFVLAVPVGRIAALVLLTVLAGVVAALVPAIRSSRVSPVTAMAG